MKAIWQNDELQSTYKKCLSDLIFWTHGRIDLLHAFQLPFLKSLTDAEWFSFPFARWERQLRAYGRQPGRPKLHTGDWRAVPLKGEDQAKLSERRLRGLVPVALELSELVDAELVDAELVLAAFERLHAAPHIGPHFVKLATLSLDAARPSLKLAADNCIIGPGSIEWHKKLGGVELATILADLSEETHTFATDSLRPGNFRQKTKHGLSDVRVLWYFSVTNAPFASPA